ncbi:MAG: tetratricopeptide repeat protein [Ferruginibacter sp.]
MCLKILKITKIFIFLFCCFSDGLFAQQLTPKQWNEDLNYLVEHLQAMHPNLYAATTKEEFEIKTKTLRSTFGKKPDADIWCGLIELISCIKDGHTVMSNNVINRYFPVRFYQFEDGIFITAIDSANKDYAGAKVLKIGNTDIATALQKVMVMVSAENEMTAAERCVMQLSNAHILKYIGINKDTASLNLFIQKKDGTTKEIILKSQQATPSNWMQWGEMFGPFRSLYTGFKNYTSFDHRKGYKDLALFMRERMPYWYEYMPGEKTIYFQLNFVQDYAGRDNMKIFVAKLFASIDSIKPDKFIIDLRFNSGGDGSRINNILHQIIKRDDINQPDKLYVLSGRKSFSAAIMLLAALKEHTNATFVGEPAGAGFNHYGDAQEIELPNSKASCNISTLYHQCGKAGNKDRLEKNIDIPSRFSSAAYFNGKDPALDYIFNTRFQRVTTLLSEGKIQEALAAYKQREKEWGNFKWYQVFGENDMNTIGYNLIEQHKLNEAITAFELNTKEYPESFNVWDSLGEAYVLAGNKEEAIKSYKKVIELNPGSVSAKQAVEKLQKQ